MLECFDPHEPFPRPTRFKEPYAPAGRAASSTGRCTRRSTIRPQEIAEIRANYAALVAACDHYFGQLLDYFDRHDLWKDTALILSTDHGFLLGEHDWWGKNLMPYYTEISHIPCIVHHPQYAQHAGQRRSALTQTMDLMPTFLESFGLPVPPEVQGSSLLPLLAARSCACATSASSACSAARSARPTAATRTTSIRKTCTRPACTNTR